jgi:hypothetical protein
VPADPTASGHGHPCEEVGVAGRRGNFVETESVHGGRRQRKLFGNWKVAGTQKNHNRRAVLRKTGAPTAGRMGAVAGRSSGQKRAHGSFAMHRSGASHMQKPDKGADRRAAGAGQVCVTEPDPERGERALKAGADLVRDPRLRHPGPEASKEPEEILFRWSFQPS